MDDIAHNAGVVNQKEAAYISLKLFPQLIEFYIAEISPFGKLYAGYHLRPLLDQSNKLSVAPLRRKVAYNFLQCPISLLHL